MTCIILTISLSQACFWLVEAWLDSMWDQIWDLYLPSCVYVQQMLRGHVTAFISEFRLSEITKWNWLQAPVAMWQLIPTHSLCATKNGCVRGYIIAQMAAMVWSSHWTNGATDHTVSVNDNWCDRHTAILTVKTSHILGLPLAIYKRMCFSYG